MCVKGYYRYEGGGKSEVVNASHSIFGDLVFWNRQLFVYNSSWYIFGSQGKSLSAFCLLPSRTLLPHTCNRSERLKSAAKWRLCTRELLPDCCASTGKGFRNQPPPPPPPLFVMHGTFKPYVSFLCITHKVILLMKHHGLDFMKQRDPTNEELIIISGKKVVSKKNSNLHISF